MYKGGVEKIVEYIAARGMEALRARTNNQFDTSNTKLDYLAIFSRDQQEFNIMLACAERLGVEVDRKMVVTGRTFKLTESMQTSAGPLEFLKIRIADPTRTQRGAPDFVISDYLAFKEKYLMTSGNFTLTLRPEMEMIELKGIDALVYMKKWPFVETLKN